MMECALHLMLIGTLRNHNSNANENVAWKYKFALLVLLGDYSNSFTLYNVAELSSNRTGGNGVQVETEIKKNTAMYSRSPQNFEFGYFTFLLGRARWRNVPKFITHVHCLCFSHYILLFSDVLVAIAVVASFKTPYCQFLYWELMLFIRFK